MVFVVVFVAVLFVVIGLASPSPTSVGMEAKLAHGPDTVRGITRITRHPFLWGVALWALMHLLVNGDLAALILFGSLLLLALAGTAVIDAKRRRRYGEQWQAFAGSTSNIPFAAIAAGRNRLGPALREIGIVRAVIAIGVYVLIFALHGRVDRSAADVAGAPRLSSGKGCLSLSCFARKARFLPGRSRSARCTEPCL